MNVGGIRVDPVLSVTRVLSGVADLDPNNRQPTTRVTDNNRSVVVAIDDIVVVPVVVTVTADGCQGDVASPPSDAQSRRLGWIGRRIAVESYVGVGSSLLM